MGSGHLGKIRVRRIWEGLGELKASTDISYFNDNISDVEGGETRARECHGNCVTEPSLEPYMV